MVDRVNASPTTGVDRVNAARASAPAAPVARAAEPAPVAAPEPAAAASGSTLQALASELAAKPPVDQDRVARIKAAIASGTYPISPENIADSLIALKLNWIPHDPS